jgi:hypothetical protein
MIGVESWLIVGSYDVASQNKEPQHGTQNRRSAITTDRHVASTGVPERTLDRHQDWQGAAHATPDTRVGPEPDRLLPHGPAWVLLEWKKPVDGGVVAAYHVQILRDGEKEWQDVTTCFEKMTVLTDQERGVELEYRVVTANKAGRGVPSNVVKVVL